VKKNNVLVQMQPFQEVWLFFCWVWLFLKWSWLQFCFTIWQPWYVVRN